MESMTTLNDNLLMLAGDTHGNTSHVITLLDNAKNHGASRIFQLGDFGAWEHTAGGKKFFDDVSRHSVSRGVKVYFLDGNHDNTSLVLEKYSGETDDEGFLVVRPNLFYSPRGHRWTWHGTRFISLGGAYSVDKDWRVQEERRTRKPGSLWFPEEEMTDEEFMDIMDADSSPVDIILSHDKPRRSEPGWNRKNFLECIPNQNRLQHALETLKAKRLYHGHLHFPYQDVVDTGFGHSSLVTGLDADPRAASSPWYKKQDSWTFLELPLQE